MLVCFLIKDRKGAEPDGRGSREELGGAGGRETIIRTYCVKKYILIKKGINVIIFQLQPK